MYFNSITVGPSSNLDISNVTSLCLIFMMNLNTTTIELSVLQEND